MWDGALRPWPSRVPVHPFKKQRLGAMPAPTDPHDKLFRALLDDP